jgi:4-hydroxy-tetrahydrodipicolinate synthase
MMFAPRRFAGVLPVLVTPLLSGVRAADESVDEPAYRKLIQRVLAANAHGVVVLGTAGEFAVLRDEQKKRALSIAIDEVAGRVPVIAGTGEPGTRRAVAMTCLAKKLGADCALVVPPYYYLVDQQAVIRHYRAVASESGLPVLLYNIPFFTKVNLEPETVAALAEEPGIAGIKDSSGNLRYFQRLCQTVKSEQFTVVTGSDDMLFAQLVAGGDGCISPGANVVPHWFMQLWNAMQENRWQEAWAMQQRIQAMHRGIGYGTFPAGIKAALSLLGIGNGLLAAPNLAVTEQQREAIAVALRELSLL